MKITLKEVLKKAAKRLKVKKEQPVQKKINLKIKK